MRASRDKDGKTDYVPADMTYPKWYATFAYSELTDNVVGGIIQLQKDLGIKGELNLNPTSIDLNNFSFNEEHINERQHNVTREEAISFMDEALFSLEKWKGTFVNYYSNDGAVFINIKDKNIRTSFKANEFDEEIKTIIKEMKKYE